MQQEFPIHLFQELRFHLRELRLDIAASIKECESLVSDFCQSSINASEETSQFVLKIRYSFENLITRLEHVIASHLSQSLKIVGQILNNLVFLEESRDFTDFQIDCWEINENSNDDKTTTIAEFCVNLQQLNSLYRFVMIQVELLLYEETDPIQSHSKLEEILEAITEVIVSQIRPQVIEIYLQSVRLHYILDPTAAKQDKDWNLLATPLREETHPLAQSLNFCPHCGATLTSDDRTFNGSYCENCRTRWIQVV